MSNQSNFSAIGALQATVGIGQYIVNDYVLTLEPLETGDGYTLTIRKGSDVQTVTLEGLSEENMETFRGYVAAAQAAQLAAEGAQTAAETAQGKAEDAQAAAEAAQSLAETAQAAAETAETNAGASATQAGTSASSAAQSATQAAGSAASAAQTLTDVQAAGQAQIAAIGAEGERVLETIPEDYTELSDDVGDLKTSIDDLDDVLDIIPASINLFDASNANVVNLVPSYDSDIVKSSSGATSVWLKVEPNTTITLDSKTDGNRCQAVTFTSEPANNSAFVQNVYSSGGNTGSSVSVTLGATENYVLFYLATSSSSCTLSNLRVYYGTTWIAGPSSGVIGDLNDLTTTAKQNLVSAINEAALSGSDYSELSNKPQINSVTLSGNKSLNDIGAASASDVSDAQDDIDIINDVLDIGEPGSVNLFDPSHPNETALIPKTDGSGTIVTFNGAQSVWLQVNANSTVTLTKTDGNRCQILTFTSQPASGGSWVQNVMSSDGNTGLSVTITTGATDVYLLCYLATSSSSCDLSKVKIFYGTEWHDATPNVIDVLTGKFFNLIPEANAFNLIANKPLGPLTKPYIAISCDDGAADLATTTIPLFKGYKTTYNKNIPLTMGLMSTSAVLNDNTYLALVNEMLEDYECEIATHGGTSYTSYSNADLVDFLNAQESFIESKCDRKPVGIIYPNHAYNQQVKAIAGSYYGMCATGYSEGIKYGQSNGARSNMYELHRWSLFVSSQTENTIKAVVDYAYENNLLLLPWFHDNALTGADATNNIALLNYLVSYAVSKGIEFISFKDVLSVI